MLTEARAMVVRNYLVENYGFDDSKMKILGLGKQTGPNTDTGWGAVRILIYPTGTAIPPNKETQPHISSKPPQTDRLGSLRP